MTDRVAPSRQSVNSLFGDSYLPVSRLCPEPDSPTICSTPGESHPPLDHRRRFRSVAWVDTDRCALSLGGYELALQLAHQRAFHLRHAVLDGFTGGLHQGSSTLAGRAPAGIGLHGGRLP